jgi:outer membrane protein TolC
MRSLKLIFIALLGFACAAHAQVEPTNSVRSMTLQDCMQLALEHNLDIQIERINPQLSLYDLEIAYAGWDPLFSASGTHNFSLSAGGLDSDKRAIPPSKSDANALSTSLNGVTPIGTTYSLQGRVTDTYGGSSGFVGTNLVFRPFENSSSSASFTLQQPLLKNFWIDSTRLNILVAKNRIKFSDLGLRLRVMSVVTSVENSYYELIFARENVKVQEKAQQLAEQLLRENKKRVEVGALAPLDEKQAESQLAARQADLLNAMQTLSAQQNALKSLLTDNFASWHGIEIVPAEKLVAVPEKFDLMESWRLGTTQRPELLEAKLDLERAGIQLKYYKNQLFPQLDVFGSYGHTGSDREFSGALGGLEEGNRPFYSYGAVVSIPLSNRSARYRYKEGKATVEQLLLHTKKTEQDILVEIENALADAQNGLERVTATRQASAYAEAALEAEQKKLENGKSTSFIVLQLQRDLTSARSAEIRALADYNKALAQIALKQGSTLERSHITVNGK